MNNDDNLIITKIKDNLIKAMDDTSKDINVHCTNGIVSLSGFVNVLFEKKRAEEIAGKVIGVREIRNNITISLDGGESDKTLTALANDNLRNSEFKDRLLGVTAQVSGGGVLLSGKVQTERDRQIAISEASKTFGITTVVSNIELSSFKEDTSLTNDVNMALLESRINVNDITITVLRGKVTLTGNVEKEEDIDRIVTLIQSISGVETVSNKLKVFRVATGIK